MGCLYFGTNTLATFRQVPCSLLLSSLLELSYRSPTSTNHNFNVPCLIMTRSPTRRKCFMGIAAIELESRSSLGFKTNGVVFSRCQSNSCDVRATITIPSYLQNFLFQRSGDLHNIFKFSEPPGIIRPTDPVVMLDFSRQGTEAKEIPLFDLGQKLINTSPGVTVKERRVAARTPRRSTHWHPYTPKDRTVFDTGNQEPISITLPPSVLDSTPFDSPSPSPLGPPCRNSMKRTITHAKHEMKRPLMVAGLIGE